MSNVILDILSNLVGLKFQYKVLVLERDVITNSTKATSRGAKLCSVCPTHVIPRPLTDEREGLHVSHG